MKKEVGVESCVTPQMASTERDNDPPPRRPPNPPRSLPSQNSLPDLTRGPTGLHLKVGTGAEAIRLSVCRVCLSGEAPLPPHTPPPPRPLGSSIQPPLSDTEPLCAPEATAATRVRVRAQRRPGGIPMRGRPPLRSATQAGQLLLLGLAPAGRPPEAAEATAERR